MKSDFFKQVQNKKYTEITEGGCNIVAASAADPPGPKGDGEVGGGSPSHHCQ